MTTITMKEYRPLTVSPFLNPTEPVSCSCCIKSNNEHYYHEGDYEILRSIMHRPWWPGFRYGGLDPENTSDRKFVAGLNPKKLKDYRNSMQNVCEHYLLQWYIEDSYKHALEAWSYLRSLYPKLKGELSLEHSYLRVLYYPPGSSTTLHADRTMFTLALWRDVDNVPTPVDCRPKPLTDRYPGMQLGVHFRDMLGKCTKHEIPPLDIPQRTLLYFARVVS